MMEVSGGKRTLEEFSDRIQFNADEREDVQKKTFTKWINFHLHKNGKPEVEDLFVDFCNGKSLLALLESLNRGVHLQPEKGRMRVHYLNNVDKAVNYLTSKCKIKLVNISSDDIVNGSPKLILGLVWSIILHWQVKPAMAANMASSSDAQISFEKKLLSWCKACTQGYSRVNVTDFTTSWSDGYAFNALIHKHRPDLIDYEEIIAVNDNDYALAHAFHVASSSLDIAKLLDPEDMQSPDKKSVLMYLTWLYEKLSPLTVLHPDGGSACPEHEVDTDTVPVKMVRLSNPPTANQEVSTSATASHTIQLHQQKTGSSVTVSDDVTTVTSASGVSSLTDLSAYNSALETTLTWLLHAKDRFNKMKPLSEDVEKVKLQFHQHESFLVELTKYQNNIGSVLTRGNTLLQAGDITAEQEKQIRDQLELLNQEWEELRVGAMERQTSLQQALMDLQQQQLTELDDWLGEMEERIEQFNSTIHHVDTLENVKKQVEEHKKLQIELEKQQEKVASLQNMVVIVEDGVQDDTYQSMEKNLEELGSRWTAICKWIDEQWLRLEDVDIKWRTYHSNADQFNKWLDDKDVVMGRMKLSDISDPHILVNQIKKLKEIEEEMDDQMARYDELTSVGQSLISYLQSFPQTVDKIQTKLDEYKARWDKLVENMEVQSRKITESGANPERVLEVTSAKRLEAQQHYDELEARLSNWLEQTERALDLQESENNELSISEQLVLIQDICEEIDIEKKTLQRISQIAKDNHSEIGPKRTAKLPELKQKLDAITERCNSLRTTTENSSLSNQTQEEYIALREILSSYSKWVESIPDTSTDAIELGRQCEQCRVKVKAMKHQEERISRLYASRHNKHIAGDTKLSAEIVTLHEDWHSVLNKIADRLSWLQTQLNQAPPRKYMDATQALSAWLTDVENLLSETIYVTDIASMEKNQINFGVLQKALDDYLPDVEYVNKTGEELANKGAPSDEKGESLRHQLTSLNQRWKVVGENIAIKLKTLSGWIESLKQFETKVNGLTNWMSDMEHFLETEKPALGDVMVLEAQISQSEGALADIDKLQSAVDEINESGADLVSGSEPEFGEELQKELDTMNERWLEIKKISAIQNKELNDALVKSKSLVDAITRLTEFLAKFDAEVSEKLDLSSKDNLDQCLENTRKLEEQLAAMRPNYDELQTTSSEIFEKTKAEFLPRLSTRLKHINTKWQHVTDKLKQNKAECVECDAKYREFMSAVDAQLTFSTKLNERLLDEETEAVDAEDMAAQMDELENLLEESVEFNNKPIDAYMSWFETNGYLLDEVHSVKTNMDSTMSDATKQAEERVKVLDRASRKSQDTEINLTAMETWMDEVNGLFKEWNTQDLLAEDLPEDYQTLKEEFSEKDGLLASVEEQVKDFRTLGKTQAADRLESKLQMVKEDYVIAQQNFAKWQRPADFEPKLRRSQQQLHEISERIYLIELYSEDPEHVEIKLDQCNKFYTTMSEMKSEVEYVIKTGRQLVAKKQVDFPKRVNQSLDAIKSMYNTLGETISQARKNLETAHKISKQLEAHTKEMERILTSVEDYIKIEPTDLDKELTTAQAKEEELEKNHSTLASITSLHEQFQEFSEESALDEAKEKLESLKERWQQAIVDLAARQRQLTAMKSNTDAEYEMFCVKSQQLLTHLQSFRRDSPSADNVKKLQAELLNLKCDVEQLVTTADDISNKGEKYRLQVSPKIQSVTAEYSLLCTQAQMEAGLHRTQLPEVDVNTNKDLLTQLETAIKDNRGKYELASLFAQCEAAVDGMKDDERMHFSQLKDQWKTKRDSGVEIYHIYQLSYINMSRILQDIENKLESAQTDTSLLLEIEKEIARRQIEMNTLNEQAEEVTERDTPPIERQLLQLNQRWVGIRSKLEELKPNQDPQPIEHTMSSPTQQSNTGTNGLHVVTTPTKQKYEYAVINKNRKSQTQVTITQEVTIEQHSSPMANRPGMTLELSSEATEATLTITSPSPVKSSPGSGIDVDEAPLSDDMTESSNSKRSMVTDLDEAAKTASKDNLQQQTDSSSDLQDDETIEEALDVIRTLAARIGIISQQLTHSGIEIDQYSHDSFNTCQDILKSVNISLEALEIEIGRVEAAVKSRLGDNQAVRKALDNLNDDWLVLRDRYKALQSNFDDALTAWTQFNTLYKCINAWLDGTEKVLRKTRDKHGELLVEQAKNLQPGLEEGMTQNQAIIHNLARTAVSLASKLQNTDAERITDKVTKITSRWRIVTQEIRSRKPRLDTSDASKCLDVLDDLAFWLDETEIIITTSPNYMDSQSLRDNLEKVKDRKAEIPYKKEALEFISKSVKELWTLPGLRVEEKERIGKDIQRINRKWGKITSSISDREQHLEESIGKLEDLMFEIGKMNSELWQAIEDLSEKITLEEYAQIESVYPKNQAITVETLSVWYREVLLLYKRHHAILPPDLEPHYRHLTIRWSTVREKTLLARSGSDSSIEETLATGSTTTLEAASADNIFEEPRQSVFLELDISSKFAEEEGPQPPPRKDSLQLSALPASATPGQPLSRDVSLPLLRERLALLNKSVSNKRVDVTNLPQIRECTEKVTKLTNAVQELIERLSNYPEADENQVSGLKAECAECQLRSISRGNELKQLLVLSHKYGDKMAEADIWLTSIERRIASNQQEMIGDTLEMLDRQVMEHKTLENDVRSWKDNYSLLNQMTEDLRSKFPNEDTSKLKTNSDALASRWSNINTYLTEQYDALNSQHDLLGNLDTTLDNFLIWLTEQETCADILYDEIQVNDPMRSSSWPERSKDLQSQIESHQRQFDTLNLAHHNLTNREDNSNNHDQLLKKRLDDMNKRWNQLRAKTVQIRSKLESSMDQWADLITKCKVLLDYLTARENELISARPVAAQMEGIKQQQAVHQAWRAKLDGKTAEFEHTLATGRFYLEREGADRRLSSASCDSRIMDELSLESNDAKSTIKNIRRHVRLLNQKWLELHNKSDRWQNQLTTSLSNLEAIDNLNKLSTKTISEIDSVKLGWKNVNDYSLSELPHQLSSARALRRRNEELTDIINKTQAIVKTHEQSEGFLDSDVKQTVAGLKERQTKLDADLSERISKLAGLNRALVPDDNDLLKDSVSRPYERATTPTDIPYYINHDKKTTQWDHPHMVNLLSQLANFNTTKFSAYRTAQKLRKLQKSLGMNSIRLKDIIRCANEKKITPTDGQDTIDVQQAIGCLRDLFEHLADDRHASGINLPLSIDLTLNWLLNVYDLGRQGHMRSFSFLVGLVIMCRGAVEDKFNYLLSCLADGKTGLINEGQLSLILSNCILIPKQLGELSSFGGANIEPSVASCLEQSNGRGTVDSRQFLDWLALEPQSMVWIPVYHRLATSESCKHQAKCNLCKAHPIIGLRYRCLRCFNFNLCQNCFFTGKKGKSHKLNHPMKEYFCASTSNDEMKDLSSPMRKKYSSGRYIKKHQPKGYLPLNKTSANNSALSQESTPTSSPASVHMKYDATDSVNSLPVDVSKIGADDSDIHADIQVYAQTLDRVEKQKNRNNANSNGMKAVTPQTNDSSPIDKRSNLANIKPLTTSTSSQSRSQASNELENDEHKIIERYCTSLSSDPQTPSQSQSHSQSFSDTSLLNSTSCDSPLRSPMQIVMSLEDNQKSELEAMIKDLEDENRNLQTEYQKLQAEHDMQPSQHTAVNGDKEAEMLAEAKSLRQHKTRLEGRMKILEDHNKQLEAQLRRLRLLLEQPTSDISEFSLPVVTSSQLHTQVNSPLRVKKLPPNYDRQEAGSSTISLSSTSRTPKHHGSIGELFQSAGQVGKAVSQLVTVVATDSHTES